MSTEPTQFEKAAAASPGGNVLAEFWDFLRHNKKWWLLPVLIVLLFLGALMLMSTTAAAPYIYTIF
jgi:Family of unknown function (DUF5989)